MGSDCTLASSLTWDEVIVIAVDALNVLNRLVDVCHHRAVTQQALSIHESATEGNPHIPQLLKTMSQFHAADPDGNKPSKAVIGALAIVCNLESSSLEAMFHPPVESTRRILERKWLVNSLIAHKSDTSVCNSLEQRAVLRATGDWNGLLSCGLVLSGIDASLGQDIRLSEGTLWLRRSHSALSAMVPAAALLRFGLDRGSRSKPSFKVPAASIFDLDMTEANLGGLPTHNSAPFVSSTVTSVLHSVFKCYCGSQSPHSFAIALNLIEQTESLATLIRAAFVRSILRILADLSELTRQSDGLKASGAIMLLFDEFASLLQQGRPHDMNLWCSILKASIGESLDSFVHAVTGKQLRMKELLLAGERSDRERLLTRRLLPLLWLDFHFITPKSRGVYVYFLGFALSLKSLTTSSFSPNTIDDIAESLNLCEDTALRNVLETEILSIEESTTEDTESRGVYCTFLAAAVAAKGFRRGLFIWDCLLKTFQQFKIWHQGLSSTARNEILSILCIYSCYCEKFSDLSTAIVNRAPRYGFAAIEDIVTWSCFLQALKTTLRPARDSLNYVRKGKNVLAHSLPQSCTYTTATDFKNQHWYHCFTCGLTDDKGW